MGAELGSVLLSGSAGRERENEKRNKVQRKTLADPEYPEVLRHECFDCGYLTTVLQLIP